MPKSKDEKQAAKAEKFLATLKADSEVFGLLGGEEYPHSLYKAYVRATPTGKWWKFESEAGPVAFDPLKQQKELKVASRTQALWTPLKFLHLYEHDAERRGLAALFARAKDLDGSPPTRIPPPKRSANRWAGMPRKGF